MKITILGCGTSAGVPMIGLGWGSVNPMNPKNRRRRCAVVIENDNARVLIDAGPDIREQLIEFGKSSFDALFITHEHADHTHGLDDTRWICSHMNSPLKLFATENCFANLNHKFGYMFTPLAPNAVSFYKTVLEYNSLKEKFSIKGLDFVTINQIHGSIPSVGFRCGDFAYCTDVVDFLPEEFDKLRGVKTLVIDCLRAKPHTTHAHIEKVKQWVKELNVEQTYLTHMDNSMDYDDLIEVLPDGIEPAYDGLEIFVKQR